MKAAILTIGDEILIGQIVDTNGAWIAENLNMLGVEVIQKRTLSDKDRDIRDALKDMESVVDLVIMTGGLGPTKDDITKNSLNLYFGGKMIENKEVLEHINDLFSKRGYKVSELNRLQAVIPDSCTPLRNSQGTAPGMWFEKSGTIFISLPGVPYEMKALMSEEVIPRLAERMNGNIIFHRTLMTQGMPESFLAAKIQDWEEALPRNVKLAYLPRPGIVRLRLTAIGENREVLNQILEEEIDKLLQIIPEYIFAFEEVSLEKVLGDLLRERGLTLATAESCTGGRIASMITSIAGSSDYFKGSVVAYSNEIKENILGVPAVIINKNGAVSKEVVERMAEGVRRKFNTDLAISVSGIAGPSGGSDEKPVGTTWICVCDAKNYVSKSYKFGDNRGRNIEISSITALNLLRKFVLEYKYKRDS
jgi:nicotinamide-nucleotide amidase